MPAPHTRVRNAMKSPIVLQLKADLKVRTTACEARVVVQAFRPAPSRIPRRRTLRARGGAVAFGGDRARRRASRPVWPSPDRAGSAAKPRCRREKGIGDSLVLFRLARAGRVDEPAAGRDAFGGMLQHGELAPPPATAARRSRRRQRMSGSRRSVPRPEQGASTSTQSNTAVNGSGSSRSACTRRTLDAPLALTVRRSRSTRRSRTSQATSRPRPSMSAAIAVVLPPGEAQVSSTARQRAIAGQQRRPAAMPRPAPRTSLAPGPYPGAGGLRRRSAHRAQTRSGAPGLPRRSTRLGTSRTR